MALLMKYYDNFWKYMEKQGGKLLYHFTDLLD